MGQFTRPTEGQFSETVDTELHDGFKLASAFHNGFACSADWFAVGEDVDVEWAVVVGASPAPDLDRLVSLFFEFGASSVCVELGSETEVNDVDGVSSDGQLQVADDIWGTIDRWMLSLIAPRFGWHRWTIGEVRDPLRCAMVKLPGYSELAEFRKRPGSAGTGEQSIALQRGKIQLDLDESQAKCSPDVELDTKVRISLRLTSRRNRQRA